MTVSPTARHWVNVKKTYAQSVPSRAARRAKPSGMTGMLRGLGLPLEGRHHSGIDDCRNIASIVRVLAQRGVTIECTSSIAGEGEAAVGSSKSTAKTKISKAKKKEEKKKKK